MTAPKRQRLAQRRKNVGFTQESLSVVLDVERTTVQRWESGERAPQPWMRPRLAKALGLNADELDGLLEVLGVGSEQPEGTGHPDDPEPADLHPYRSDPAEVDDMHRRGLLRLLSMAGAMLALPPADDVPRDETVLEDYAQLNSHLWQVFTLTSAKTELLPLVRKQLNVLSTRLGEPHGPDARRRLCALAGDLLQVAGEIFFDRDAYTEAAHCYAMAAEASKEAGAFDLWACAMTRHAFISVYERKFHDAAPMLELADALARRGDPGLSSRHWVAVVQAQTFAGLGDLSACQRALDTAEGVREMTGTVHNGGWLRFDGARLAEERGTCYATLGRTDLAETALTDALRQNLSPRRRAGVLTDLAVIGVQRRAPDRVVAYGQAALAEARQTGSGVISRKLHGLQRHLVPLLADKQVQQLNAEITALTGPSIAR